MPESKNPEKVQVVNYRSKHFRDDVVSLWLLVLTPQMQSREMLETAFERETSSRFFDLGMRPRSE
jgi:hypothetical protein